MINVKKKIIREMLQIFFQISIINLNLMDNPNHVLSEFNKKKFLSLSKKLSRLISDHYNK